MALTGSIKRGFTRSNRVSSDMAITTQLRTKGFFPFATNSPFNRVSNLRVIGKVAFVNKYYINNNDNTIIMN